MSLYGAIAIGVAGLDANSTALSITSSNIANVNTVGYKADSAQFSSLVDSSAGLGASANAGVVADSSQNFTEQGLLTSTSSATDLAISGQGMFVVTPSTVPAGGTPTDVEYTRAGNFTPDASGNLVNAAGNYLLGWQLDSAGNPPTDPSNLSMINVNSLQGQAQPSTTATLQANLQASAAIDGTYTPGDMTAGNVTPDFQRTVDVFDSQGGTQPLQMSFIKTGANTWSYEVSYTGTASNIGGAGNNPIATGTMSFNSDGTLATADTSSATPTGDISVTIPWAASSGLQPQTLSFDMGTPGSASGFTQFDAPSTLASSTVDGAPFGSVTGVSIGKDGVVTAQFSNGLSKNVFEIPVATFPNVDGLAEQNGNAFSATSESGTPVLNGATTGSAGSIMSGDLENSTVDLATEFTNLITTQRAYSASSRIVTTASQMLDQLMQMQ
jgi:flagellar hook protein FlgE